MQGWITGTIDQFGYAGVFVLMFLENVFPPLPSELIMPLAGYVAQRGEMQSLGVILAGTAGSCLGQIPLYFVGKFLGAGRLKRWLDRFPWLAISPSELDRSINWFSQHGSKAVFFGRLIPGIRTLISIPAGICGMNLSRFMIYTACGSLAWTTLLTLTGRWLGERHHLVESFLHPISFGVIAIISIWYAFRVVSRVRKIRRSRPATIAPPHHSPDKLQGK